MLIYDLICSEQHRFEGWFQSADDYQRQQSSGLLTCPVCASPEVNRIPSAAYVQTRSAGKTETPKQETGAEKAVMKSSDVQMAATMMQQMRDYLQKHSENVGENFAEEAKKIHYGEADERSIHGKASKDELIELREEGIQALPLPGLTLEKDKLN